MVRTTSERDRFGQLKQRKTYHYNCYLSDGTKVLSYDAAGDGYMYFGTARFTLDNNVPTFESIPFSGGRIVKTSNGYEPQYYLTDHLGSTRAIVNNDGQTVDATFDYTPFGVQITGASLPTNSTEYRFSGKELQNIPDSEIYDFGARQYFPKYAVWGSVDPLAEQRQSSTPFAFCSNNPIARIDLDGQIDWPLFGYIAVNKKDYSDGARNVKNAVVRTSLYMEERNIGTSPHIGIDYRANVGTPVYSLGDGIVKDIGTTTNGIKFIIIEYGNGDKLRFMHMNNISSDMKIGESVFEGQIIGESGNSGTYKSKDGTRHQYQAHLHVDATDKDGNKIDPEANKYGTLDSRSFFEEYNGDYLKLLQTKKDAIERHSTK